jgi:ADP-ribose pyrophosphatase YjhB (NUDIX family)
MTNISPALRRRVKDFAQRAPWLIHILQKLYQFTRPKYTLGVTGVLFNPQGQVLLVEHVLHPHHPWGLPGGWVDAGEKPPETLAREMREEVGLEVTVGALLQMEMITLMGHIDFAYACTAASHTVTALSPELLAHEWYNLDALPDIDPFQRAAIENARDLLL